MEERVENKERMARLQIEITFSELKEVKDMMLKTGLRTRKSLIDNCRTLFEWAIKEKEAGRLIGSMNEENGRFKEMVMPSLENVVKNKHSQE